MSRIIHKKNRLLFSIGRDIEYKLKKELGDGNSFVFSYIPFRHFLTHFDIITHNIYYVYSDPIYEHGVIRSNVDYENSFIMLDNQISQTLHDQLNDDINAKK